MIDEILGIDRTVSAPSRAWSTDIVAAMELFEKFAHDNYWSIVADTKWNDAIQLWDKIWKVGDEGTDSPDFAETIPLAICRAVLRLK